MKRIKISDTEKIHWWQWVAFKKFQKARTFAFVVSRQHGKSWIIREVLKDFIFRFDKRKNPHALVVGKTTAQVYDIAFSNLEKEIFSKLPARIYSKQGDSKSLVRVTIKRTWLPEPDYVTLEFCGSGAGDALRGRTSDLVIGDEAAFWPIEVYDTILRPTTSATDGKILLTSTVHPKETKTNWFWKVLETYKAMNEEGESEVDSLYLDIYSAQLKSNEWIATEEELHRRTGRMNTWRSEYLCKPGIADSIEAPFAERAQELLESNRIRLRKDLPPELTPEYKRRFATIDLGKPGNNPCWIWVPKGNFPDFLGYKDDDRSQYAVLDRLVADYPGVHFTVIYPDDVLQPAVMDGAVRLELLQEYVRKMGYSNRISLEVLPRTKSRPALVQRGVEIFHNSNFDVDACKLGLEKLTDVRMRKEAVTGYISDKDFVKNDMQHAADALLYVAAALDNGYAAGYRPSEIDMSAIPTSYQINFKK